MYQVISVRVLSEARWTGREAKESAVLRDVIYACSLYSTDPHGPRSFPASLTELQRWLDSANAAKEWGSSSLSPSRADLGQEVVGLQHDRKVGNPVRLPDVKRGSCSHGCRGSGLGALSRCGCGGGCGL